MPLSPIPQLPFTLTVNPDAFQPNMFGAAGLTVSLNSGLITLLGPNGSGKTSALKAIKNKLRSTYGNDVVRYLSAGRMGAIEMFRSDMSGTGMHDPNQTYTGSQNDSSKRKLSETVTGDFLALQERSDIKLKVEARLQGIFGKTLILEWVQSGLKIHFKSIAAGSTSYGAGLEASGLTQMVAILAALYDNEIKFLLIDEPEVSLHPQLQSFILREIKQVAGDPNVAGKKVVLISTHSPQMVSLKTVTELPSFIFFRDVPENPIQVATTDPILTNPALISLVIRLTELYKIALFSKSVLLCEGVSDEIIISTLVDKVDENFSSNGNQLVSVNGKDQLLVACKLFILIGKKVSILGDIDILDGSDMVAYLSNLTTAGINLNGFSDLEAMYDDVIEDLISTIQMSWNEIEPTATTHSYWKVNFTQLEQKRCAICYLLQQNVTDISALPHSADWLRLRTKLNLLLDNLDKLGLTLIRKGTIENCYIHPSIPANASKPIAAGLESSYLLTAPLTTVRSAYMDVIKAIDFIKQKPKVDEAYLLRTKLGSVLGQIIANITADTTDQEIQNIIDNTDKGLSNIFRIRKTVATIAELRIEILSPLFAAHPSPIIHLQTDNIGDLQTKLPSS